jgi:hypothetical protein
LTLFTIFDHEAVEFISTEEKKKANEREGQSQHAKENLRL